MKLQKAISNIITLNNIHNLHRILTRTRNSYKKITLVVFLTKLN